MIDLFEMKVYFDIRECPKAIIACHVCFRILKRQAF